MNINFYHISKFIFKKLFGFSIFAISIYYIFKLLNTNYELIKILIVLFPIKILLFCIFLNTTGGIVNSALWFIISKEFNDKTNFLISYKAWSIGRIYRYLPGKIFGYIARHAAQKDNLKNGIYSSANEYIISLIPIFILAILFFTFEIKMSLTINLSIFLILFFLLFSKNLIKITERVFEKFSVNYFISENVFSPIQLIKFSSISFISIIFHGLSFYFLVKLGLRDDSLTILNAIPILYLAGLAGQLSIVSPGGLGTREASLSFLMILSGTDESIALSAAVMSRMTLFLSELVNVAISRIKDSNY